MDMKHLMLLVSDRTEPDMSFELFEPDKSPVQLSPDFWLEPMSRTFGYFQTIAKEKQTILMGCVSVMANKKAAWPSIYLAI